MLRSARRAGIGESADGKIGFALVKDWYALVMTRSWCRRTLGSSEGGKSDETEDFSRSLSRVIG